MPEHEVSDQLAAGHPLWAGYFRFYGIYVASVCAAMSGRDDIAIVAELLPLLLDLERTMTMDVIRAAVHNVCVCVLLVQRMH